MLRHETVSVLVFCVCVVFLMNKRVGIIAASYN